jgi:ketosteroid isomerase-like protein
LQPVAELIREIYVRHAAGDVDGVLSLCRDDISFWWVATNGMDPHADARRGREAFKARLEDLHETFHYHSLEPVDLIAAGDRAATRAEARMTHRASRRRFTVPIADFWTIRDGRVCDLIHYFDTALIADVLK